MIYFTVTETDCGIIIDSISESFSKLKEKFPEAKIYVSKKLITSINIDNLNEYTKVSN